MSSHKSFLLVVLFASALALASCSGFPVTSSSAGGGGGGSSSSTTTALSFTLVAAPQSPPTSVSLLSLSVDVTGISLTPSTGNVQSFPLNSTTFTVDLTKLQSDSAFLGTSATVPAGSYTAVTVSFSNPVLRYCLAPTQTTSGCGAGGVLQVSGGGTAPPITTSLTLTAGQQTGFAIDINLQNAITISPQGVPFLNLAASNVLSVNPLPATATSLGTGQLDFVEDVTGVVTTVNSSASSVTVQTATRGSITATANSLTVFPFTCATQDFSCVQQGAVASLDMALDADGSFTLLEYDPIAATTGDWIEGIVTAIPSSSTQFEMVANDLVVSTSSSLIGTGANALVGAPVQVTLSNPSPFTVDSKGLTIPAITFSGTDASILLPGQTVAVQLTSFTPASGNTPAVAIADALILRFTRVTGTVDVSSPPTFSIENLPPLFGLVTPQLVQLSTGSPSTNYDGVTGGSALGVGQTVSIRALYFGPFVATPFSAAKVREP
jgi:hypothetical protein